MESPVKALKEFKITASFVKRAIIAFIGVVIMGITVGLMQRVGAGADPYSAMCRGLSDMTHIDYRYVSWGLNGIAFLVLIFINWKLFGLGTILNMVVVGAMVDVTYGVLDSAGLLLLDEHGKLLESLNIWTYLAIVVISLICFLFGVGLYIDSNLGTSPYDAIPNLFHQMLNKKREKKIAYRMVRIPYDLFFAVVALLLCGWSNGLIITFVMAVFLGPIVDLVAKLLAKFVKF